MALAASRLSPRSSHSDREPRTTGAPALPLRDWKRAFAIVDRLNAEFRGSAWFRGIRAFWDERRAEIGIEVQVVDATVAVRFPAELRGRAILVTAEP